MALKPLERLEQFEERRTIAQGARLALDHSQIMVPVVNRALPGHHGIAR